MYHLSDQLERQMRAHARIQIIATTPAEAPPAPPRRMPIMPNHDFLVMSAQPELNHQPAWRTTSARTAPSPEPR